MRAEPLANPQPAPAAAKRGGDLMTSPLIRVLLMAAASLALLTMLVAALPLAALERITETHWRTEQVATFVDGHRLDLVVGGVGTKNSAARSTSVRRGCATAVLLRGRRLR
jgi:hypothetical protein